MTVIEGRFTVVTDKDCCANCRFWFDPEQPNNQINAGVCRRNPPVPIPIGTQNLANGQMNVITQAAWPMLLGDSWCGEHRSRTSSEPSGSEDRTDHHHSPDEAG